MSSSGEKTGTIPEVFQTRKTKILEELSVPDSDYTDLSPKGSVDEGIRDLINDINALPGLVTTSSCAGRVSVFLEGRKKQQQEENQPDQQRVFAPSGGKGAGRWMYVSHEPVRDKGAAGVDGEDGKRGGSLHDLIGMVPGDGKPPGWKVENQGPRLLRFHFEPLILHIMTANLQHAHPVLSAASSSGFRESGLQSLRCLEGDDGPSPIVAVRSAGLALESVIGYCDDDDNDVIRSLVTEEYLEMLIAMSNERFSVNAERRERFRKSLLSLYSASQSQSQTKGKPKPAGWEDPEKRRERKRAEGLMRKKLLENETKQNYEKTETTGTSDQNDGIDYVLE